eukprot:TRINITY_DN16979_c0_g1_i1.p4 TRINITY_DN16979_c0_g1~~TRINITY_DN16979_c0_g1_i1.p4  ORF type:complete len:127 (-),score=33.83 TRINITY_DN16979_c0_g1_i1:171-551(-)
MKIAIERVERNEELLRQRTLYASNAAKTQQFPLLSKQSNLSQQYDFEQQGYESLNEDFKKLNQEEFKQKRKQTPDQIEGRKKKQPQKSQQFLEKYKNNPYLQNSDYKVQKNKTKLQKHKKKLQKKN